jgi:hypothetical protein
MCTNLMHKPNAHAMTKPFLPKGSRTYHIHPRVPMEYREAVGSSHVTRSLGTRDFKDAKKRVHSVMQRLHREWDAKRAARKVVSTVTQVPGRITSLEGFWFDNPEHACAYFYEKVREREQAWSVNRRGIFTPDRRAIGTPLADGLERVGDRSCGA